MQAEVASVRISQRTAKQQQVARVVEVIDMMERRGSCTGDPREFDGMMDRVRADILAYEASNL